jgi:DHA2 family multidrug resistance protein
VAVGYAAFMSTNVLTPNWLQRNMGYTATWAGLACGMVGLLAIVAAPAAAKLSAKVDPRGIVFVGLSWMAAVTFLRSGLTSQVDFATVALGTLLMGLGMPLFFLPLNTLALSSVDPQETAAAAGLFNFARTLSGAIGVSIVNTAWEDGWSRNQSELAGLVNGAQQLLDRFMAMGATDVEARNVLTLIVRDQAIMLSTNQLMLASAAAFLAAAAIVWLAPKPSRVEAGGFGH